MATVKKIKVEIPKKRNLHALAAIQRKAGKHKDKKKEANKKACRSKEEE